jgi:hypothetical protein
MLLHLGGHVAANFDRSAPVGMIRMRIVTNAKQLSRLWCLQARAPLLDKESVLLERFFTPFFLFLANFNCIYIGDVVFLKHR